MDGIAATDEREGDARERPIRVDPVDQATAERIGDFAATLLLELRTMARNGRCAYLAYLLELSLIEASDLAAGRAPSPLVDPQAAPLRQPVLEATLQRILDAHD